MDVVGARDPFEAARRAAFHTEEIEWALGDDSSARSDLLKAANSAKESISACASAQRTAHAETEAAGRFARSLGSALVTGAGVMWLLLLIAGSVALAPALAYAVTRSWLVTGSVLALMVVPLLSISVRVRVFTSTPSSRSRWIVMLGSAAVTLAPAVVHAVTHGGIIRTSLVIGGLVGALAVLLGSTGSGLAFLGDMGFGRSWRRNRLVRSSILREWQEVLLIEGLLPFLRQHLNERMDPRLSTSLDIPDSPGLRTSHKRTPHIQTQVGRELARTVDERGRGSFALAGPRGTGKTSLLRAFCDGRYRDEDRNPDLTVMVAAPVEYEPKEFVLHLYATLCRRVIDYARALDPQDSPDLTGRHKSFRTTALGISTRPTDISDLAALAANRLFAIRSLQTRTREISGKAGRAGVELSGKQSVAVAMRALTYPEIVDELTAFLMDVAATLYASAGSLKPARVIVCIDELDRMGTGEQARKFLNEIKGIFTANGCFFLVSVSEDALYEFDLASPGMRSVFDSSFDEVVLVPHLDFATTRDLLDHQVIGLPVQFAALLHILSGGVPRDLARHSAALLPLIGRTLPEVACRFAETDLERVRRSAKHLIPPDHTELLRALATPPDDLTDYAKILQHVDEGGHIRDVVVANVLLLAKVLEIFTADLGEPDEDLINTLAEVRRDSGISPAAAVSVVRSLRGTPVRPK